MLSEVWIVPVWVVAVSTACLRPLLRRGILLIMRNPYYYSMVNRVVDRIMFHHDDTETLVSFLRSPDVVGIVKDYCSVARQHESFLYTYARYHTVRRRTKGIHPDPERLPTLRERYHDLPTELEDETRQVIEADGVLILLRILIALVTTAVIVYQSLIEKETLDTYHVLANAMARLVNSGILPAMADEKDMTLLVTSFRYPSSRFTPVRAIAVTIWWIMYVPMVLTLLVYPLYFAVITLIVLPIVYIVKYVESLPYLGTKLYSTCENGYYLYVLGVILPSLIWPILMATTTSSICWTVSSFDGWWEHSKHDFFRRIGFMVPTDMVSIFQLLSSL
jgi:hypothetical protein